MSDKKSVKNGKRKRKGQIKYSNNFRWREKKEGWENIDKPKKS